MGDAKSRACPESGRLKPWTSRFGTGYHCRRYAGTIRRCGARFEGAGQLTIAGGDIPDLKAFGTGEAFGPATRLRLERGPVVSDPGISSPVTRLEDHEIESQLQPRDGTTVRQRAAIKQTVPRLADAGAFAVIDRLLSEAEPTRASPAHLDDHERGGRTRVDRHEIEFVAADMDVPGQDGPTGIDQSSQDQRFGGVTRQLGRGPGPAGRRSAIHAPKTDHSLSSGPHPGMHHALSRGFRPAISRATPGRPGRTPHRRP